MKLLIVSLADIAEKIARPGTAIAARRVETGFDLQRIACDDRHQFVRGLHGFELVVVLNARQIQAIDFFVLPKQRVVGGTEERVIKDAFEVASDGVQDSMMVADAMERIRGATQEREHHQDNRRSAP